MVLPDKISINSNTLKPLSRCTWSFAYSEAVEVNEIESYNLIGSRPLCVLLNNKIDDAKEKGYLEDKQRVGQTGFTYLEKESTIEKILNEAISLNPDKKKILESIKDWAFNNSRRYTPEEIKEMFTSYLNERGPQSSDKYISSIEGKVSEWCRKHKFVGETVSKNTYQSK